jgi:nitrite reductase/ring-hydroxylating ferredoxin subunit
MADDDAPRWRAVAATAELPPGHRRVVEYDGRRVLLLNVEGKLYAFESICPHQAFPLDDCAVSAGRLECPYHQYTYRLDTGENDYPAAIYPKHLAYLKALLQPLTRFQIRVEGDEIVIAPNGAARESE